MRFVKVFKLSYGNDIFYACLQLKLENHKIFQTSHVKINNSYIVSKSLSKRNIKLGTIYSDTTLTVDRTRS